MTDKEKVRAKHLARKFCKRHNVYAEFDSSVAMLIEHAYVSAYFICLHTHKLKIADFEQENAELKSVAQFQQSSNMDRGFQLRRSNEKLSKAKELLKWALHSDPEHDDLNEFDAKYAEAEEFLKEVE